MKKNSIIFKMICLSIAVVLSLSVISVLAEDFMEIDGEVTTEGADETVSENDEFVSEDVNDDATEPEDEEEEEVLDLFAATLRDGGVYVTPGNDNAAVFTHDGLRYRVEPGTGNEIKLDGFESNPTIDSSISDSAKYKLQANGEVTTKAAHSGYYGLSVSAGEVIYRAAVTTDEDSDNIYVFSAWMKMPKSGSISDDDRAFKVIAENGNEYVVGWNEIGRMIELNGSWQQILFTFKAPETGVFQIKFNYSGREALYVDDIELYKAEIFDNPLTITSIECKDANNNAYSRADGFTTAGTLTHTTTLYNSDEDDVFFTAVMVLFKNDILIDIKTIEECALVLDETDVTFEIDIPKDEDITQYKYMVYFVNDAQPTQYYGEMPALDNPYIVQGK